MGFQTAECSSLNNEKTRLIGMKLVDAIKQTLVEQGFSQPAKEYEEELLDVGTKVGTFTSLVN